MTVAIADVIKEARTHFYDGKIEEGDTYVFQCQDGVVIISKEDDAVKFEAIAGAEVIKLESRLEIATEPKDDAADAGNSAMMIADLCGGLTSAEEDDRNG